MSEPTQKEQDEFYAETDEVSSFLLDAIRESDSLGYELIVRRLLRKREGQLRTQHNLPNTWKMSGVYE